MKSHIMIIDPKTDGAEVRQAQLSVVGAWVEIACKDLVIRVQSDDIVMITGDEGHG